MATRLAISSMIVDARARMRQQHLENIGFAGKLTDVKNVGVMGDEGTYESDIRLRAVVTNDFMSADVFRFDDDALQTICNRIINEVKGVNRVFYDRTQKPPGTIEWE